MIALDLNLVLVTIRIKSIGYIIFQKILRANGGNVRNDYDA